MPKIFINPGHCIGKDAGACGNGLQEAEVALNISKRVQAYLQAVGYDVKLFYFDGLQQICDDANAWNADLFVSIHCNAANSTARGTKHFMREVMKGVNSPNQFNCARYETFYAGSDEGRKLAESIQAQIISKVGTVDRGVKLNGFYVIKYTNMPAVLVETAFIDNPQDAELLVTREDDFARAIACGITDYFQVEKLMPDTVDVQPSTKLSAHFDVSEFACHHCGQCIEISPRLIELLEQLRENIGGYPLHINSGYRCKVHNANIGGVSNSQHVQGTAADVAVPRQLTFREFQWYVTRLPFDWVGLYPYDNFIHVDVRAGGIFFHQGDYMQ